MRVRILRDFTTANDTFHAGEIREISPRKAEAWLRAGWVMQDKSLDGARETKVELKVTAEVVPSTKRKRKTGR